MIKIADADLWSIAFHLETISHVFIAGSHWEWKMMIVNKQSIQLIEKSSEKSYFVVNLWIGVSSISSSTNNGQKFMLEPYKVQQFVAR